MSAVFLKDLNPAEYCSDPQFSSATTFTGRCLKHLRWVVGDAGMLVFPMTSCKGRTMRQLAALCVANRFPSRSLRLRGRRGYRFLPRLLPGVCKSQRSRCPSEAWPRWWEDWELNSAAGCGGRRLTPRNRRLWFLFQPWRLLSLHALPAVSPPDVRAGDFAQSEKQPSLRSSQREVSLCPSGRRRFRVGRGLGCDLSRPGLL